MYFSNAVVALVAGATFGVAMPGRLAERAGDIAGLDISSAKPASFWSCVAPQFGKVAIRGYSQACGSGGAVDKNLIPSYKAAKAAGIKSIDVYMFPCTGKQPNGKACKAPATQLAEFENAITSNGLFVDHLWFDIEPTSGVCNAWNLGASANAALAKQWTALLRKSSFKWGIYANGNQWTSMFASRTTDVGSDLPLWAVQADSKPGVSTVHTFMGGWTSAVAKQYHLDTKTCGGSVDLDSFSGTSGGGSPPSGTSKHKLPKPTPRGLAPAHKAVHTPKPTTTTVANKPTGTKSHKTHATPTWAV